MRRLQSELMALMMGGDPGVSAFPEGDNIFHWVGTVSCNPVLLVVQFSFGFQITA